MLFVSLLTLIVAIPLYAYRITPQTYIRITIITFVYSALLAFNSFYIESIQSGISIYNGLFQITTMSQRIEIVIYIVGIFILFGSFRITSKITRNTETMSNLPSGERYKIDIKNYPESSSNINYNSRRFEANKDIFNEFSLMILFTTIGASFLISSSDVVSIYLSIELQSFAVYVLAALYRNSESATAAGLKYFLLGGLSSAIILLGTGIVYRYTGVTQIESIFNIISSSYSYSSIRITNLKEGRESDVSVRSDFFYSDYFSVLFGVFLITIGLLFKVAAAPFHNWAPDVYDGVPTIIRSWITTMPKISIFILLLEINSGVESLPTIFDSLPVQAIPMFDIIRDHSDISNPVGALQIFKNLLLVCSLLSLIIGTVVGLSQYRIKRLLAFSTISHVGFMLLALAIFTEESIDSFLFYIFQYSITNANVFLILLAFGYRSVNTNKAIKSIKNYNVQSSYNDDVVFIEQLKGQFYSNPLLSLRFAISLFSMAGIPPLVGFFAKQMVLYSSIHNGYYFISFVAILVSVISASYYLKIIQIMYFNQSNPSPIEISNSVAVAQKVTTPNSNSVSSMHSIAISVITIFITLFIIDPSIVTNSCQILSLSIFNY